MIAPTHDRKEARALIPGLRDRMADRAEYMMGSTTRTWPPDEVLAWEGFLELHRIVWRDAVMLLDRGNDLSVSMLAMMGRLADEGDQSLSQTALADAVGLSLSRVSRIVDILERRGLVERSPCPSDGRTTNVALTAPGLAAVGDAQAAVRDFVRKRFLARLTDDETTMLARLFARLIDDAD